jgi:hypothetical protein
MFKAGRGLIEKIFDQRQTSNHSASLRPVGNGGWEIEIFQLTHAKVALKLCSFPGAVAGISETFEFFH